jgi:energy-coupling factor transporter ATP-binding protein EcfA2
MEKINIRHRAKHYPQQLSGGQQQRVAVARALVTRPKLILADEPTGNLDSTNGNEVMNLLAELHREGSTIVMVTHSSYDASFSSRIVNMKDGEMVYERGGRLVHAIFGFCDIRNFTDCTEILRANIVNLVNGVAKHVHTCVLDNYGAPNKNIGDAFLLVWKPKRDVGISMVADSSLRSYVRAIIQVCCMA